MLLSSSEHNFSISLNLLLFGIEQRRFPNDLVDLKRISKGVEEPTPSLRVTELSAGDT